MPSIKVNGMHCANCQKAVTQAISSLPGVVSVNVDLQNGQAGWEDADPSSPIAPEKVKEAVNDIGFEAL